MIRQAMIGGPVHVGAVYLSVENFYEGVNRPFNEIENRLHISTESGDEYAVDEPLTRDECLELAQMFLSAALNDSWPNS
jgi:hypothetical protein